MDTPDRGSVVALLALAVPATLALFAAASPRRAGLATLGALGLAALFTVVVALSGGASLTAAPAFGVRADAATCVMLLLVASLGAVVVRYAQTYLDGDPGLSRMLRGLLLTLSAVTVLVVARDLRVIALAWTATSVALHQLLTFYSDRPAALLAAHKKFLVSRLADVCLLGALALVHASVGSFDLDRIAAWAEARTDLPPAMHAAALLLVVAVALRSAQLPFHGWLTQVMEAPTPVSALLHAGVVNIGGFVLIRVSPWIAHAAPARLVLVVVGLASATVASLVMTTRVSVKVALAWSTCAQMGFMLLQCGLGLWPLALVHLVAHSLYKAHAFLSAGSAVDTWKLSSATPLRRSSSPLRLAVTTSLSVACALLGALFVPPLLGLAPLHGPADAVLAIVVAFSLVPLSLSGTSTSGRAAALSALRVVAVVALYLAGHAVGERLLDHHVAPPDAVSWAIAAAGLAALFVVRWTIALRPDGRLARALHPWLFSGLYLDELFTRATFRVWPPRLPRSPEARSTVLSPDDLEVRA